MCKPELTHVLAQWKALEHVIATIHILNHLMHFCEGAAVEWNAREQRRLDQTGIVLHVRLMPSGHEVARLKCHQVDVDGIQCVQACWVKGHDVLHVVRPCNVGEGSKSSVANFRGRPPKIS